MTTTKELRDLSAEELDVRLEDLHQEVFELRNELKAARKLEKPHLLREKRRELARVLTLITERETGSAS